MAVKSSEAINVRFLINPKTRRIVFAEAGKEFVDFLFSLLSLPIGATLKLLYPSQSGRKVGSVSNLYDSMETLPTHFMSTDKSHLLDPKFLTTYSTNSLRIEPGKYYACCYLSYNTGTTHNISTSNEDICSCGNRINQLVQLRQNTSGSGSQTTGQGNSGYVTEMFTFIVTDDLKITGSSTFTIMTLLNQLNIKDLTDLEERTAVFDYKKAVKLLEASLVSTTVLNDVFGAELSVRQGLPNHKKKK